MSINEKYIVWKWANPSKKFLPKKNRSWGELELKSHEYVVFAGLNPTDWMWLSRPKVRGVLHKIELSEEQAQLCVVAEQDFRPSDDEMNEYLIRTGRTRVGSNRGYSKEKYEGSFIPLPRYNEEHFLPEVLIPFEINAKSCYLITWWLKFKKKYFSPRLGEFPSRYRV